mmetsp:Transcript_10337/g.30684  ORF Transcript_10337/g.30684 Transcript_10337/m.30684 type:complete len:440 (+) Transcript_10337:139-1458(+)
MTPSLLGPSFPLEHVLTFADAATLGSFELTCRQAHSAVTHAVRDLVLGLLPENQHGLLSQHHPWRDLYRGVNSRAGACGMRWSPAPSLDRPRFAHSTVVYKGHVIVFGGRHGPEYMNDVATLSLRRLEWLPDTTRGSRPSPKRAHTAVVCGQMMYVLGGGSDTLPGTGELHALDLEILTWRALSRPEGWSYLGHTCVSTPDDRLVVFGGCWWGDEFKVTDDLRAYSVREDKWSVPEAAGSKPCARYRHSMVRLPSGDGYTCVMYGGYVSTWRDGCPRPTGEWCYNRCDMLSLDTRTFTWTKVKLGGHEPLPRGAHSCCALGDSRLLFFGGGILYYDGVDHMEADCDELFAVDTRTWTFEFLDARAALGQAVAPTARGSHGAVVVACGGTLGMLMLGGRDYNRQGSVEREIHRGRADGWLLSCDGSGADGPVAAAAAAGS